MTLPSPRIPENTQVEAEHWFSQLMAPDCPPEQREAFTHWLQVDPAHRQAYLGVERLWERLGEAVQLPAVQAMPEAMVASEAMPLSALVFRPRTSGKRTRWPARMAWVGGLAACVLAVVGLLQLRVGTRLPESQILQSGVGESRSTTLADGSVVTLDTDSRIAVAFDRKHRWVTLEGGAAFFDVAPDATRPFVVITPMGRATVLGTQFQVRHVGEDVQVVLVKGALRLDDPGEQADIPLGAGVLLRPGQQATRSPRTAWQVAIADLNSTAWREGRLVFHDTPLPQAVDEVNRYTRHKLRVGDPALSRLTVSGVFRIGDPDSFVLVLENTLPVRGQTEEDQRVLLRK